MEVGNHMLKNLPYGGVFLIGGVTNGIQDYILNEPVFMELINAKGRLAASMQQIPVYLVKPEVELGLLGAEEKVFRNLKVFN